ncbi:hypothetical protein [Sorangium sp. So ce1024]|uniref:hypothetical protein n=1 Tax=unclassified Sorangium TaxID=2621164 RepID=UPI003F0C6A09
MSQKSDQCAALSGCVSESQSQLFGAARCQSSSPEGSSVFAEGMRAALAAGDVEAARIAHEAIGRLLGAPGADAAGIIDLAAERVRRGG